MNPVNKLILKEKIKESITNIADSDLYEIILTLDKIGALNDNWDGEKKQESSEPSTNSDNSNKLPKSFHMVSPMFQGNVSYATHGEYIGYKDDNGNIRIFAKSEKDLLKKVKKYKK